MQCSPTARRLAAPTMGLVGNQAQSFAQLLDRVGRRAAGVQNRLQLRIRITKSVLISYNNFFKRARFLSDSGCEVSRGRRLLGERRQKVSAEHIEYLSRINGRDERIASSG